MVKQALWTELCFIKTPLLKGYLPSHGTILGMIPASEMGNISVNCGHKGVKALPFSISVHIKEEETSDFSLMWGQNEKATVCKSEREPAPEITPC